MRARRSDMLALVDVIGRVAAGVPSSPIAMRRAAPIIAGMPSMGVTVTVADGGRRPVVAAAMGARLASSATSTLAPPTALRHPEGLRRR